MADQGIPENDRSLLNRIQKQFPDVYRIARRYDYMTGLPTLTYFFELGEEYRKNVNEEGGNVVLLFIDLCGMKFFNVKYSFEEGDSLIRLFADMLKRIFTADCCCHSGADHFIAVTKEERLEDTLSELFSEWKRESGDRFLPVRVGIYSDRTGDVPISDACDRAKFACDDLRGTFESCYSYYHQDVRDEAVKRHYVMENIDRAIRQKWIQVYYQPIVRAISGRVCDEEALSRWIDPERGMIYPDDFIPALEETRLIYKLDLYVLEQVLEKIKVQEKCGVTVVPVSVNLSRADFEACDMVEEVRARVDAAGVDRNKITIEITESVVGNDFDYMKEQIERFRALGFPVWMDDFGSGYSSLDVLQNVTFDLIKFDMNFLKKMDKGNNGKIIMTQLMRMATSIGVDTVCEGVETPEQVEFLKDIGCSKLQGFYFSRPVSTSSVIEGFSKGTGLRYEEQNESEYFAAIGRVDLNDISVIAKQERGAMENVFDNFPMAIVESRGGKIYLTRTNKEFREVESRLFGSDVSAGSAGRSQMALGESSPFMKLIRECGESQSSAFADESLKDGSVAHFFAKRVGTDQAGGRFAVAAAVLSITPPDQGTTYAAIARALASDYYNIYYIDLDTDDFIEYTSAAGKEDLAEERHGRRFFSEAKKIVEERVYENDREHFLNTFTKENIQKELRESGVFTITYRLIDSGKPVYVNMKITRMPGGNHIIMGVSVVDAQMKQKVLYETTKKERDILTRIMTLDEGYLTLYSVDAETGRYYEYGSTEEFGTLNIEKSGEDFFEATRIKSEGLIHPDDMPEYMKMITRESIFREIREKGAYNYSYRLLINGKYRPVTFRIVSVRESDGERLVAGIRKRGEWQ